ncbi:MAG: formate/nitrite transporter family protein [Bacteroides sp.]|nr:formate/nitrite transporter family protein [Prevotella sp.]MCM1407483.1 formate/nitrite transporter family protein [Treponema brennaborense]MCM1469973.1 formate/nitrite transporter family protein [Bacteroides sp.]
MNSAAVSDIKKSVLAGFSICVGGIVYLSCISKGIVWLGAVLFSAGLFTILEYGFGLYTGKVGYIAYHFRDVKYESLVVLTLVFNLLSTFLLGIAASYVFPEIKPVAANLYETKLASPLIRSGVSAFFCGFLMYLAVDTWKRGNKIGCFLYIPTFILCGFEHSIADSLYNGIVFGMQAFASLRNLAFIAVVIIGNAAGGMLVPLLTRCWNCGASDSDENAHIPAAPHSASK